jgi:nucleotide-binding universal stress UspA family protein
MSEPRKPSVLTVADGSDSARSAALWARRFARERGANLFETPPFARSAAAIDFASKLEVDFLVSGLRCDADGVVADVDDELITLMRRAPCPVWTVQPWAADTCAQFDVAVVGVDTSPEARAAAYAAAALLRGRDGLPQLILVHGLELHPHELAATRPWAEILASMKIEQHPWIERLAGELADERLLVESIVKPTWAPELIGAMARCRDADFIALGSAWQPEHSPLRASPVVRKLVRATPCPILTV